MRSYFRMLWNYLTWLFAKTNGNLIYKKGDATIPHKEGVLILHSCNNRNQWGAGFVVPLAKRYPETKIFYRRLFNYGKEPELGYVQFVPVTDCFIANMIAQDNSGKSYPPARLDALEICLQEVAFFCFKFEIKDVQLPRICMGIGGIKDWSKIEKLLKSNLIENGINVTVFDL